MKLSSPSQIYFVQPLNSKQPFSIPENKESAELKLSIRARRCKEIQMRLLSNRNMLNTEANSQRLQQRTIF